MGQLTRSQIVSEGLLRAGNDSLTTHANVWLNAWLRKQYEAWPWPFLQVRASGISLASGTQSLLIGANQGGVSDVIRRFYAPITFYTSDYTTRGRAYIRQLAGNTDDQDENANNPATFIGLPTQFKARRSTVWGRWNLVPTPFPDRDLLLAFDYIYTPGDMDTSAGGDSVIPIYPNDDTMIAVVEAMALRWMKFPDASEKLVEIATRAVNDRVTYGSDPGSGDLLQLDGSVFL